MDVPDTASYIRGWVQMVLAPNDLFSWNNKYSKYIDYNDTDTFTCSFSAMHTTYYVFAGILKPWRGRLPWLLVVFSSYHVFTLPLSGLKWRSLFPPWGSCPPSPKMAPPFTGSTHTPLPGSGTMDMSLGEIHRYVSDAETIFVNLFCPQLSPFVWSDHVGRCIAHQASTVSTRVWNSQHLSKLNCN